MLWPCRSVNLAGNIIFYFCKWNAIVENLDSYFYFIFIFMPKLTKFLFIKCSEKY